MLVLSRRRNESVVIGESIEVFVVQIRGDKVRLGIRAPAEVRVDRAEIRALRQRAVSVGHDPLDTVGAMVAELVQ